MNVCQFVFFSLVAFSCGSGSPQYRKAPDNSLPKPLINLLEIAGQTQEDIATVLGPQSGLTPGKAAHSGCPTCQKYSYQDGKIVITYINDMADWITLFPPRGTPARQTPALLGLPDSPPVSSTPTLLRWTTTDGIREILTYIDAKGMADSVRVVVKTP